MNGIHPAGFSTIRIIAPQQALQASPKFGLSNSGGGSSAKDAGEKRVYEAKPNPIAVKLFQLATWRISNYINFDVKISKEDRQLLKQLAKSGDGVILTPNHSSDFDLLTIMEMARKSGIRFNAMGAVEIFEPEIMGVKWKIAGKLLQRLGVFSVDRSNRDKSKTLEQAEKVVAAGKQPLLMFPEGYVTHTNELVEPLKSGAARIALAALDREGFDPEKRTVKIVPVSLYFHHRNDIRGKLEARLDAVEETLSGKLGVKIGTDKDDPLYQRINEIFDFMVKERENRYKLLYATQLPADVDTDDAYRRLAALREMIIANLENKYYGETVTEGTHEIRSKRLKGHVWRESRELIRRLNALRKEQSQLTGGEKIKWRQRLSPGKIRERYDHLKQAIKETREELQPYRRDLETLADMESLTMYPPGYLVDNDQKRVLETLSKLERDVNGGTVSKMKFDRFKIYRGAWVEARIRLGEPIDVKAVRAENPDASNTRLANLVTKQIRNQLQTNIDAMDAEAETEVAADMQKPGWRKFFQRK